MAKARLLAFLLCDNATRDSAGKVTLHGVFDTIIAPRTRGEIKLFFVCYRVVVEEPCAVALRVFDPEGHELAKSIRRDELPDRGPI